MRAVSIKYIRIIGMKVHIESQLLDDGFTREGTRTRVGLYSSCSCLYMVCNARKSLVIG